MAPSTGISRPKITVLCFVCVCLILTCLPLTQSSTPQAEELRLTLPHDVKIGHTILSDIHKQCMEVFHIQKSHSLPPRQPFSVTEDRRLVLNSSVVDVVDDVFVIQRKPLPSCVSQKDFISQNNPIQIGISQSNEMLHFVHDEYHGTLSHDAIEGTKVTGITDLYACAFRAKLRCSKNLDYRLRGSRHFYLQTIYKDSQIQLQVFARDSFHMSHEESFNFIIIATNADSQTGHTSVFVKKDEVLRYRPGRKPARSVSRRRREVPGQETLPSTRVNETASGILFSVKSDTDSNTWVFVLKSSTLDNVFDVTNNGDVRVANGAKLDYEYFVEEDLTPTVTLTIEVKDSAGIVVKELVKPIIIEDVNDEMPMFTSKPSPFLATVSPTAPANTVVYTITAADPDASAQLTLTGSLGAESTGYFKLENGPNEMTIKTTGAGLQADTEYMVQVVVSDNNAEVPSSQSATATINIFTGSRDPQFFNQDGYVVRFQENNAVDQLITLTPIHVVSFQRNPVTFSILNEQNQPSTTFLTRPVEISGSNVRGCQILVTKVMDYETAPRVFALQLIATESVTGLASNASLRIEVTDKNEYNPRFTVSTYKTTRREDIAIGSSILEVTAFDQDYGSILTFSVDDDHFEIGNSLPGSDGSTTAIITVHKRLDFDRRTPPLYDFNVYATDNGVIPKTGNATIRVFMQNVNDEDPILPEMDTSVRYDAVIGTEVFVAKALDFDAGDTLTYTLVQPSDKFSIDKSTGRVTLIQPIAAVQTDVRQFVYILQIRVTDDGGCCTITTNPPTRSTVGNLTINILTDNLSRPTFLTCSQYNPQVREEAADEFVIKVVATDTDIGINSEITYSLRNNNSQFRIDAETGNLYTRIKIDREALKATAAIPVNVIATDGGNLAGTCPLRVIITDINDNKPTFVLSSYQFSVLNTLDVNDRVQPVEARDADIGENAIIQYSILDNPGDFFRIENYTGLIRVDKPLSNDNVTLIVEARDGGTPSLASNVSVNILLVDDINQLPPLWIGNDADFIITVNETVSARGEIMTVAAESRAQVPGSTEGFVLNFKVIAVDGDDNMFSLTSLRLDGKQQRARLEHSKPLDYETKTQHRLTLRASDIYSKQSDRQATIIVMDINDNVPYFLGRNEEDNWLELELPEGNHTGGTFVSVLQAQDDDKTFPNNQTKDFKIVTPTSLFTINSVSGLLQAVAEFDRETQLFYSIFVQVIDGAPSAITNDGQPNTGQVNVKITITDINDNPPKFLQDNYVFNAREDLILDAVVNKTEASDPDSAAVLRFSIPRSDVPFKMQSQTGEIKVAAALDYETGPTEYIFAVVVTDSLFQATATVTINIIDVNDNPPVVQDATFKDFFENDTSIVGPFYTVTPTDIDFNGQNTFYYALKFTNTIDEQYFEIGRTDGRVSIRKPLDRDYPNGSSSFVFTVEVADEDPNTGFPLYGYGTITVEPIDINDNAPFVEDNQMAVPENKVAGTLVGRVPVQDYDAGKNQEVNISIIGQVPTNVFVRDGLDLKTTVELDRETISKYYVTIRMVDNGDSPLSSTATLTVSVLDENDNKPEFNTTFQFVIPETQPIGTVVGRIQAYDKDEGINAALTYSLSAKDNTHFKMDQDTTKNQGILVIFNDLDFDDPNQPRNFTLTAYAVDRNPGLNNENQANTSINIIVTDYNDETPEFTNPQQSVTVSEGEEPGTRVLATFVAHDKDDNEQYSTIKYFIEQKSDPLEQFAINDLGNVTLKNYLDYEAKPVHTVHILAIDNPNGLPQMTGTATLTVKVGDINDNYPDFANYTQPVIEENKFQTNAQLMVFSVTDADGPNNREPFSFEIRCPDTTPPSQCTKFSLNQRYDVNPQLGEIYFTGEFDREEEKIVTLPFYMCDLRDMARSDQQCGMRYLDVIITDVNDNLHQDAFQEILVYNYKGLFGEIVIGKVNTNDPDENDNDKLFELQNSLVSGFFVDIHPNTGVITLKNGVPEMSFEVKVLVKDQQNNAKTTTVRIQVVYITEDAVYNSGSVRIKGITPADFLLRPKKQGSTALDPSMYDKFRDNVADALYGSHYPSDLEKVQLLSVMQVPGQKAVDVRVAAHGSPWYSSSRMDGIVSKDKQKFENAMYTPGASGNGTIDMVPVDMCKFETCEAGCFNHLEVKDTPVLVNSQGGSFVGVNTMVIGSCGCRATNHTGMIHCTPGHCYHGGECVQDNWGVVSCKCPEGFDGPRCQQLRQSFDGTGYALYRQLEQCETSRTSIEVLTTKPDSLILFNGPMADHQPGNPRDFILLELQGGVPKLRVDQGTGELELTLPASSASRINDGTWHRIDIIRTKKSIKLMVDNCVNSQVTNGEEDRSQCEVMGITPGENYYINVASLLQLGGRVVSPSVPSNVSPQRFLGCMRNLRHNTELYDLSTGGQFPGAEDGCPSEDEACGQKGCEHGRCEITAVNSGGIVQGTCICDDGFRTSSSQKTCDTETTEQLLMQSSFMEWQLKQTFKLILSSKETAVSLHVRTRDEDGIIFSFKDETSDSIYITLRMVSRKLQLTYNLGDAVNDLVLKDVDASDGQWHKVTIQRFGKEFILMMDSGEGRYYAEYPGNVVDKKVEFNVRRDQLVAGGSISHATDPPTIIGEDLSDSCLNDVRFDQGWFPMVESENSKSPAATLTQSIRTEDSCAKNDCPNKCTEPQICIPLWGDFRCECPQHFNQSGQSCIPFDYCSISPCFGGATCTNNVPPADGEHPFICACPPDWYGDRCHCHPSLNAAGGTCNLMTTPEEVVPATGMIVGIVLGILFLIAAIILIAFFVCRRGTQTDELLEEDPDDDLRENIMYYDEEGAGEEDMTRYDLSRLRKPDDGEHPTTWDAPDVRKNVKPLGSSGDRPDIGDFIDKRLNDADDDPNSPPFDTPFSFNEEGGGSEAGSLSSLNTSSSGDQDYDYLHEWGPKFAKLADMYNSNNYDEDVL